MFTVRSTVATVALLLADTILGTGNEWSGLFGLLCGVATVMPSLAVGARRLHDTGRSGWWQLIALVPIVGLIVLIVWWATVGDGAQNQWGRDPALTRTPRDP